MRCTVIIGGSVKTDQVNEESLLEEFETHGASGEMNTVIRSRLWINQHPTLLSGFDFSEN